MSVSRERNSVRRLERVAQIPGVVQPGFKFKFDFERRRRHHTCAQHGYFYRRVVFPHLNNSPMLEPRDVLLCSSSESRQRGKTLNNPLAVSLLGVPGSTLFVM
jgi:hypothetical protein